MARAVPTVNEPGIVLNGENGDEIAFVVTDVRAPGSTETHLNGFKAYHETDFPNGARSLGGTAHVVGIQRAPVTDHYMQGRWRYANMGKNS